MRGRSIPLPWAAALASPVVAAGLAVAGASGQAVVRVGAVLFAAGGVAAYVAAGTRRPRRDA